MFEYNTDEEKNSFNQNLGSAKTTVTTTAERTNKVTLELKGDFGSNNTTNKQTDNSVSGTIAKQLIKEYKND